MLFIRANEVANQPLYLSSFEAPPGYLPATHSHETISTFSRDTVKGDSKKQLWIVKIPEEISPDALDGLVIKVPSSSASTLAKVKIQTPAKGSASQTQTKSYLLRSHNSVHRPRGNGLNSTQLIAMAGGLENDDNDANDEPYLQEGLSFQVLLPLSGSHPGRYGFSEKKTTCVVVLFLTEDCLPL